MNYAATSHRKPQPVLDALGAYLAENTHMNAGRGGALLEMEAMLDARLALCGLFGAGNPAHVIFTSGVTMSLNMALRGLLMPGDHVLATSVEHNAVARVLHQMESSGIITVTYMPCARDGTLDPSLIEASIRPETRLLVMTHASNVLGTILPAAECCALAKRHGLFTVLDTAQTAGYLPITTADVDVLCFTGHKGLLALPGSGGFVVSPAAAQAMRPVVTGGTGSHSDSLDQPDFLPDKFEPGTPNAPGIRALGAAARHLLATGLDGLRAQEQGLTQRFIDGAREICTVHGTQNAALSTPVVSISAELDAGHLAQRLLDEYGIVTRSGLHCSPLAHKTAGTFPAGTVRFSFGPETTVDQIDYALDALRNLLK